MKNPRFRLVKPVIWLVELVVIGSLAGSIISLVKKQDVVRERAGDLAKVQEENDRLKRAIFQAESDSFVEREARNMLGLVKPGETMVLVAKATESGARASSGAPTLSRWAEWWRLFF